MCISEGSFDYDRLLFVADANRSTRDSTRSHESISARCTKRKHNLTLFGSRTPRKLNGKRIFILLAQGGLQFLIRSQTGKELYRQTLFNGGAAMAIDSAGVVWLLAAQPLILFAVSSATGELLLRLPLPETPGQPFYVRVSKWGIRYSCSTKNVPLLFLGDWR